MVGLIIVIPDRNAMFEYYTLAILYNINIILVHYKLITNPLGLLVRFCPIILWLALSKSQNNELVMG